MMDNDDKQFLFIICVALVVMFPFLCYLFMHYMEPFETIKFVATVYGFFGLVNLFMLGVPALAQFLFPPSGNCNRISSVLIEESEFIDGYKEASRYKWNTPNGKPPKFGVEWIRQDGILVRHEYPLYYDIMGEPHANELFAMDVHRCSPEEERILRKGESKEE